MFLYTIYIYKVLSFSHWLFLRYVWHYFQKLAYIFTFDRKFIIIAVTRFLFLLQAVEFEQLEAGKAVSWLGERLLHEINSLFEYFDF